MRVHPCASVVILLKEYVPGGSTRLVLRAERHAAKAGLVRIGSELGRLTPGTILTGPFAPACSAANLPE